MSALKIVRGCLVVRGWRRGAMFVPLAAIVRIRVEYESFQGPDDYLPEDWDETAFSVHADLIGPLEAKLVSDLSESEANDFTEALLPHLTWAGEGEP